MYHDVSCSMQEWKENLLRFLSHCKSNFKQAAYKYS